MKLITTIVLIMSLSVFAKDGSENCDIECPQHLRGSSGTSEIFKFASMNMGISEEIRKLSIQICWQYTKDATQVAKNVKKVIVDFLIAKKKEENPTLKQVSSPSSKEIIRFLNKHRNQMLCGNTNYMVKSFEHGAYDELFNILFYEDLLIEDEELYIDINAISYTGPPTGDKPETVLDYMYREVKNPILPVKAKKEIQDLIDFFESKEIGGKRYTQLPKKEKTILLVSE